LIQNNDIVDGTGNGIEIWTSDYVRILNNDINGNDNNGIYISNAELGSNHVIRGNTINNNGNNGIEMHSEDGVTIDDNIINNNGIRGMAIFSSFLTTITSNRANNNGIDGLYLDDGSINNTVNSNRLCNNGALPDIQTDLHNGGFNNTGDSNTCDTVFNWNDTGTTNCTHVCSWSPSDNNGGGGGDHNQDIGDDIGGDSFTTHRGTSMHFDYGGYEYSMSVDSYNSEYSMITITLGRETYEVYLGETINIDLDGDGQPDISVTYEGTNANTVPVEVSLKVVPYTQGTTSGQPVSLAFSEEIIDDQPVIVVKVIGPKVEQVTLSDSTADKLLKSIKVKRITQTIDTGRMASGITLLAISILGVLGLGYFFKRKK
jgi:hypothetical protein